MRPVEPREYLRTVCLAPFLEKLPAELEQRFVDDVADALGDPIELDYVRLNVTAQRAA
jgi:hypothetical protein